MLLFFNFYRMKQKDFWFCINIESQTNSNMELELELHELGEIKKDCYKAYMVIYQLTYKHSCI